MWPRHFPHTIGRPPGCVNNGSLAYLARRRYGLLLQDLAVPSGGPLLKTSLKRTRQQAGGTALSLTKLALISNVREVFDLPDAVHGAVDSLLDVAAVDVGDLEQRFATLAAAEPAREQSKVKKEDCDPWWGEVFALGVCNVAGPCFGAYAACGTLHTPHAGVGRKYERYWHTSVQHAPAPAIGSSLERSSCVWYSLSPRPCSLTPR